MSAHVISRPVAAASACLVAGLAGIPGTAAGQPADESITVLDAARDEFPSYGTRLGAFVIEPELFLDTTYTDNVFAASRSADTSLPPERTTRESDVIFRIRPKVSIATDWPSNALRAYAELNREFYLDFNDESATTFRTGGEGMLELGRFTRAIVGGGYRNGVEARTDRFAPVLADERVKWDESNVYARIERSAGIVALKGKVARIRIDYHDVGSILGGTIDQDFRDRDTLNVTLRGGVEISPALETFVRGGYSRIDYDVGRSLAPGPSGAPISVGQNRDANEYRIEGGASFDVTRLVRGEAALGYTTRDFDDPSFDKAHALSANVNFDWFVTPITTVHVTTRRSIREALSPGAFDGVETSAGLSVDHRLLERLVLSAGGEVSRTSFDGFVDTESRPADRRDEELKVLTEARYYLARGSNIVLSYQRFVRDSSGLDQARGFTVNEAMLRFEMRY